MFYDVKLSFLSERQNNRAGILLLDYSDLVYIVEENLFVSYLDIFVYLSLVFPFRFSFFSYSR